MFNVAPNGFLIFIKVGTGIGFFPRNGLNSSAMSSASNNIATCVVVGFMFGKEVGGSEQIPTVELTFASLQYVAAPQF